MHFRISLLYVLLIFFIAGCASDLNDADPGINISSFSFDFSKSQNDWYGDFADYKVTDSLKSELLFDYKNVPPAYADDQNSVVISGFNRDEDLFLFVKKKIGGLSPNKEYTLVFKVNYISTTAGVAADGDSVRLKVGAVSIEPKSIKQSGYYRLNIDKGSSGNSGKDMVTVGAVVINDTQEKYNLYEQGNSSSTVYPSFKASTNSEGEVWLIVGTNSSFSGLTTIYYTKINVVLSASN